MARSISIQLRLAALYLMHYGLFSRPYLLVSCNNFVRFITKKMAFIHDSDISGNPAFMLFNPYQRFPCPNFASIWLRCTAFFLFRYRCDGVSFGLAGGRLRGFPCLNVFQRDVLILLNSIGFVVCN